MARQPLPSELGDVVIWELSDGTWQLRDQAGATLIDAQFKDLSDARELAIDMAGRQRGRVWLHRQGQRGLRPRSAPARGRHSEPGAEQTDNVNRSAS
jgi:hypothetical protein